MLIALAGCDGAGKSTQTKELLHRLLSKGYSASMPDKWDVMSHDKFPECRFITGDLKELKTCIADMEGVSRAMIFFWTLIITLSKENLSRPGHIYLLDGYWMKHAAGEIALGVDRDWIMQTVQLMPVPDVTIYLDIPPKHAAKRKGQFTLMECGRIRERSFESFLAHQTRMREQLLQWCNEYNWNMISALQDKSDVQTKIDSILTPFLP